MTGKVMDVVLTLLMIHMAAKQTNWMNVKK